MERSFCKTQSHFISLILPNGVLRHHQVNYKKLKSAVHMNFTALDKVRTILLLFALKTFCQWSSCYSDDTVNIIYADSLAAFEFCKLWSNIGVEFSLIDPSQSFIQNLYSIIISAKYVSVEFQVSFQNNFDLRKSPIIQQCTPTPLGESKIC